MTFPRLHVIIIIVTYVNSFTAFDNDDMKSSETSCNVFFVNFPFKMFLKIDLDKKSSWKKKKGIASVSF